MSEEVQRAVDHLRHFSIFSDGLSRMGDGTQVSRSIQIVLGELGRLAEENGVLRAENEAVKAERDQLYQEFFGAPNEQ